MSIESSMNWPGAEPPPLLPNPRRRWPLVLFVVFVLSLASAGAFYVWLNGGLFIQTAGREGADADAGSTDKAVITDLLASQQKTSDDLAALDRAVADQQEQLKAIVSQLSSLSAKIDSLKSPAVQAPVPPSFPSPPAVATPGAPTAQPAPAPTARSVPKQKRPQPRATNSTGPISVGGAPLTTAPNATAH